MNQGPVQSNQMSSSSHSQTIIQDQLFVMIQREYKYNLPHTVNNLEVLGSVMQQHHKWRRQICEWCYNVVDHSKLDWEVVSLAMDYFDRHIMVTVLHTAKSGPMCSKDYQLVAMTSSSSSESFISAFISESDRLGRLTEGWSGPSSLPPKYSLLDWCYVTETRSDLSHCSIQPHNARLSDIYLRTSFCCCKSFKISMYLSK